LEKLYYENPYQKEFTAEIINVLEKDNKYHIELDRTYFYPESKNHPSDSGYINASPLTHVYEENEKIYHVVEVKPSKIHKVKCIIDWQKKYDYMQQHLGQHIISSCLLQLFNANTVAFHIEKAFSYIDIDRAIDSSQIRTCEEMCNKIIFDNIAIEILYPTKSELKKLSFKKLSLKSGEKIRVAKIGDIHISPCVGLLPNSTIEAQAIKIIKLTKTKDGTRIEFISGSRAISDYLTKHQWIDEMSNFLHCNTSNLLNEVEKLSGELNKALSEKALLKAEVAQYEVQHMLNSCENMEDIRILKSIYDSVDLKYISLLASKLVSFPKVIVLFGVKTEDKAQLIFMRSKDINTINMNFLLKDAITLIDGKGGGNEFSAQGGGKNNNNLGSSIEYAYNKIKESIYSTSK
jgi:alanyl-tRNA synthetase